MCDFKALSSSFERIKVRLENTEGKIKNASFNFKINNLFNNLLLTDLSNVDLIGKNNVYVLRSQRISALSSDKKKGTCAYPGCNGSGNTNRISLTHRKLKYCPLAKKEKGAKKKKTSEKENKQFRGNCLIFISFKSRFVVVVFGCN